jgi:hypothetical protein
MNDYEHETTTPAASKRYRGPQGLGEQAAEALGDSHATGPSLGGMAEDQLRAWAEAAGCLVPELEWLTLKLVSAATAENEVRYRASDHRAVKRTWPGTFGFVPRYDDSRWAPSPASPLEYLHRLRLQNDLFQDDTRLEGVMVSDGPSMIIGQPAGGLSLVTSQGWLDAADSARPHPTEAQIAEFMKSMGFVPLLGALFGWQQNSGPVIILDAKPDNFILTEAGILPIDLVITETSEPVPSS